MNGDELRAAADRATELLDQATPGPWHFDYAELTVDNRNGNPVCGGFNDGDPDAALIAAAPDLLAVLAPAARQYADTQVEVQRLRTVLDGLLNRIGDPSALRHAADFFPPSRTSLADLVRRIADAAAAEWYREGCHADFGANPWHSPDTGREA